MWRCPTSPSLLQWNGCSSQNIDMLITKILFWDIDTQHKVISHVRSFVYISFVRMFGSLQHIRLVGVPTYVYFSNVALFLTKWYFVQCLHENQTGITLITECIKRPSLLVYKRWHLLLSNVWIYHLSPCNFSTRHLMNCGTLLYCYFQRITILVLDCSVHTGQDGGTQICLPQITWIDLYSCAKQSNHPEIIVYLPLIYEHLPWHIREQ